uniref:Uncharacterized protein n=1 Tax=Amphimedon queenslandica TaxID=400682 RepID=A0A1X7STL0_AMPQE
MSLGDGPSFTIIGDLLYSILACPRLTLSITTVVT